MGLCGSFLLLSYITSYLSGFSERLSLFLVLLSLIIGGYPIFKSAAKTLLIPDLNVDTLVSVASMAAIYVGAYKEAATVIFILLFGEFLEKITINKTKKAISSLIQLTPKVALVKTDKGELLLPVEQVKVGDTVIVKPGERIPVDGYLVKGSGFVNQSIITGESMPVEKGPEDKTYSGTINESGSFEMKVSQVGEDTKLSHIKRLILEAQSDKAPIQRQVDRYSRYFIPLIFLIALIGYIATGNLIIGITILIVACPCSLVLGTPTAVVASMGKA
ncbi:MAG: HAD-IC family P-type ATPase, partial [Candidatus Daviesbacteria bacterium]|nr:HAD-IC family P-type ATPase [Candidatus Daviesbacteria bacterium]